MVKIIIELSSKVISLELEVREMKINKNYVEQVHDISDKNENKEDIEMKEKLKMLEAVVQKSVF